MGFVEVRPRIDICVNSSNVPGHVLSHILYRDANGYHNESVYYTDSSRKEISHTDVLDLEMRDVYAYCVGFYGNHGEHFSPQILDKKEFERAVDSYYFDLAARINDVVKDIDIYEYRDNVDNEDDAVADIHKSLRQNNVHDIKYFLKSNVVDARDYDFDYRSSVLGMITELDNCCIKLDDKQKSYDKLKDMVSRSEDEDVSNSVISGVSL